MNTSSFIAAINFSSDHDDNGGDDGSDEVVADLLQNGHHILLRDVLPMGL